MQTELEKQIYVKLNNIENELKILRKVILPEAGYKMKKPVSFRGIAKTRLTENELDKAIEEAKKSLFLYGRYKCMS